MDKKIFIVQFCVRGVSRKLEFIVRCSTSCYALADALKHLAKKVPQPAIEKIFIKEFDNLECVLPF